MKKIMVFVATLLAGMSLHADKIKIENKDTKSVWVRKTFKKEGQLPCVSSWEQIGAGVISEKDVPTVGTFGLTSCGDLTELEVSESEAGTGAKKFTKFPNARYVVIENGEVKQ